MAILHIVGMMYGSFVSTNLTTIELHDTLALAKKLELQGGEDTLPALLAHRKDKELDEKSAELKSNEISVEVKLDNQTEEKLKQSTFLQNLKVRRKENEPSDMDCDSNSLNESNKCDNIENNGESQNDIETAVKSSSDDASVKPEQDDDTNAGMIRNEENTMDDQSNENIAKAGDNDSNDIETKPKKFRSRRFNCSLCEKVFPQKRALSAHVKRIHSKDDNHSNSDAKDDRDGTEKTNGNNEKVNKDPRSMEGEFECPTCKIKFNYESSMIRHTKHMHKKGIGKGKEKRHSDPFYFKELWLAENTEDETPRVYDCILCDVNCDCMKTYLEHLMKEHSDLDDSLTRFQCPLCPKVYFVDFPKKYITHLRAFHVTPSITCQFCAMTFQNCEARQQHEIDSHTDVDFTFRCSIAHCCKVLKSKLELASHVRSMHTEREKHQCLICKKLKFSYKTAKKCEREHIIFNDIYGQKYDKYIYCEESNCDFKCVTETSLVRHRGEQHKDVVTALKKQEKQTVRYQCDLCGQLFTSPQHVRQHKIRKHEPKVQLQCPECPYQFSNIVALRRHMSVHKPGFSKSFCDHCGKGFNIKRHMLRHLAHNCPQLHGYKCPYCKLVYKGNFMEGVIEHLLVCDVAKSLNVRISVDQLRDLSEEMKAVLLVETAPDVDTEIQGPFYPCGYCKQKFTTAEKCELHEYEAHGSLVIYEVEGQAEEEKCHMVAMTIENRCLECRIIFKSPKELEHHNLETHSSVNDITCKVCHRVKARVNLAQRCASKHFLDDDWHAQNYPHAVKCQICQRKCVDEKSLAHHVRNHAGVRRKRNAAEALAGDSLIEMKCMKVNRQVTVVNDNEVYAIISHPEGEDPGLTIEVDELEREVISAIQGKNMQGEQMDVLSSLEKTEHSPLEINTESTLENPQGSTLEKPVEITMEIPEENNSDQKISEENVAEIIISENDIKSHYIVCQNGEDNHYIVTKNGDTLNVPSDFMDTLQNM
ncbi:unnamed protein product [Owenia fusiformis]|nr:unnamed protein product [Owenia fusiformis]